MNFLLTGHSVILVKALKKIENSFENDEPLGDGRAAEMNRPMDRC